MAESGAKKMSGWLWVWSSEVCRYDRMWFVLLNGVLTRYDDQEENCNTCRGGMSLAGATVDHDETRKFVVCQDGEAYHVKAVDPEDKERWVEALIASSETDQHSQDSIEAIGCKTRPHASTVQLPEPTTDVKSSADALQRNQYGVALNGNTSTAFPSTSNTHCLQSATSIEALVQNLRHIQACNDMIKNFNSNIAAMKCQEAFWVLSNHAAGYQEIASAMTKACADFTDLAQSYVKVTMCSSERGESSELDNLVKALTHPDSNQPILEDETECERFESGGSGVSYDIALQVYQVVGGPSGHGKRRTRVPDRPNVSDSLWSVLKNCIGNDLSKMPLPVSFSEPLSLLQRLTEDFEYAQVLDRASECTDASIQIAHVAAFISSSYSTTIGRNGKPFNPLLGETYECDRQSDLGWKSIAEQVSHHPPMAAIHCEGKNWEFWMDQSMKTKFKGATLTVIPLGECHLRFKNGNRYSWKKPLTSIHNVIIGKLWVEQEGDVDIKCHTSSVSCKVIFSSSGWTGEPFTVKGSIKDDKGKAVFDLVGKYSTAIEYRPSGSKDPGTTVWTRTEPPADNAKYYNFTILASQLNEMENDVAPTDSRRRPDQRIMEEGNFDGANIMKKKLEEFQRANKKETWTPSWFKRQADPDTGTEIWTYGGEYWTCKAKKDWSRCPAHIFTPP